MELIIYGILVSLGTWLGFEAVWRWHDSRKQPLATVRLLGIGFSLAFALLQALTLIFAFEHLFMFIVKILALILALANFNYFFFYRWHRSGSH